MTFFYLVTVKLERAGSNDSSHCNKALAKCISLEFSPLFTRKHLVSPTGLPFSSTCGTQDRDRDKNVVGFVDRKLMKACIYHTQNDCQLPSLENHCLSTVQIDNQ